MQDKNFGKIQIVVRLFEKHDGGLNEDAVHSFTTAAVKKICELLFGKIKSDKKVRFANDGLEKYYYIDWKDDLYTSREGMISYLVKRANEVIQGSDEINEILECSDYEKVIGFDKDSQALVRARFDLSAEFVIKIGDELIPVEPLIKRRDIYVDGDKWYAVDVINAVDSDHNSMRCKCGKTPLLVKFGEKYRNEIFDAARDRASTKLQIEVQKEVLASKSKSVNGELMDLKVFKQEALNIF